MTEKRFLGIDVGTGNIISAERAEGESKVQFRKVRDAFFKIDKKDVMGGVGNMSEKMLKKTGTHYIKIGEKLFILGDSAFKLASTMHKDTLRPMKKGILNPNEPVSAKMVEELLKAVTGKPKSDDDVLYFCIPANPIDADYDVEYHRETLHGIFRSIGYENVTCIDEGLAIVFSDLAEQDFTGLGISFGAGMCNITYAFMGMPVLSFAISKGGDYIDESSAKQVNENASTMTIRKERMKDLRDPKDEYEKAIAVYYKSLLKYLVQQIKTMYESKDKTDLPNLFDPIDVVVAGGTSLAGGFIETFEEIVKEGLEDTLPIGQVRHAEEPLYAVAHGLFQASKLSDDDEDDE